MKKANILTLTLLIITVSTQVQVSVSLLNANGLNADMNMFYSVRTADKGCRVNLGIRVCTSILLHTVLQAVQKLLGLYCRVLIRCIWISIPHIIFLEMELFGHNNQC